MNKEPMGMEEIHKIRESFYLRTKNKNPKEILRMIKETSARVEREIEGIKPNPHLIIRKRYSIPESETMKELHRIRERSAKYRRRLNKT